VEGSSQQEAVESRVPAPGAASLGSSAAPAGGLHQAEPQAWAPRGSVGPARALDPVPAPDSHRRRTRSTGRSAPMPAAATIA